MLSPDGLTIRVEGIHSMRISRNDLEEQPYIPFKFVCDICSFYISGEWKKGMGADTLAVDSCARPSCKGHFKLIEGLNGH